MTVRSTHGCARQSVGSLLVTRPSLDRQAYRKKMNDRLQSLPIFFRRQQRDQDGVWASTLLFYALRIEGRRLEDHFCAEVPSNSAICRSRSLCRFSRTCRTFPWTRASLRRALVSSSSVRKRGSLSRFKSIPVTPREYRHAILTSKAVLRLGQRPLVSQRLPTRPTALEVCRAEVIAGKRRTKGIELTARPQPGRTSILE